MKYVLTYPKPGELGQWYNICLRDPTQKHGLGDCVFETQNQDLAHDVQDMLLNGNLIAIERKYKEYVLVKVKGMEPSINEGVVATIDNYCGKGEERLIIHSHIDHKGKMVLNRVEAALLLVEIHKFLSN